MVLIFFFTNEAGETGDVLVVFIFGVLFHDGLGLKQTIDFRSLHVVELFVASFERVVCYADGAELRNVFEVAGIVRA